MPQHSCDTPGLARCSTSTSNSRSLSPEIRRTGSQGPRAQLIVAITLSEGPYTFSFWSRRMTARVCPLGAIPKTGSEMERRGVTAAANPDPTAPQNCLLEINLWLCIDTPWGMSRVFTARHVARKFLEIMKGLLSCFLFSYAVLNLRSTNITMSGRRAIREITGFQCGPPLAIRCSLKILVVC